MLPYPIYINNMSQTEPKKPYIIFLLAKNANFVLRSPQVLIKISLVCYKIAM